MKNSISVYYVSGLKAFVHLDFVQGLTGGFCVSCTQNACTNTCSIYMESNLMEQIPGRA